MSTPSNGIEEKTIVFVANGISRLKSLSSRSVMVQNLPWSIEIKHRDHTGKMGGENTLAVYLHCLEPGHFSCAATATIHLVSFNANQSQLTNVIGPWVFNNHERTWSRALFIRWTELFNRQAGYVKSDRIIMRVQIAAQKYNPPKAELMYQQIFNIFQIHFRIENIRDVMAANSNQFTFSGLTWKAVVRKKPTNDGSHLGIMLYCIPSVEDSLYYWQRTISAEFRLISEHAERTIQIARTGKYTNSIRFHGISKFISWDDLMNPQNQYIQNKGISFTVNIRVDSSNGQGNSSSCSNSHYGNRRIELTIRAKQFANGERNENIDNNDNENGNAGINDSITSKKMLCSICLENMIGREVLSTICGHVYCKSCLLTSMVFQKRCPNCQTRLTIQEVHPLYLPL